MVHEDKYNPAHRTDNCGFCSLSVALDLQGNFSDAETLYRDTIKDLGLEIKEGKDPVSRLLIFPEHDLESMRTWGNFENLTGAIGLNNYTITSVADKFRVAYEYQTRKEGDPVTSCTTAHFLAFYAARNGRVDINEFIDFKREQQSERKLRVPSVPELRHKLTTTIVGDSILGSIKARHYLTMRVAPDFQILGFDPQDYKEHDAKGLMTRMRQEVNLVMHLKR